jgi:hypothetical protein
MREILRNYLRNKGVGRFPAFLSPATGCIIQSNLACMDGTLVYVETKKELYLVQLCLCRHLEFLQSQLKSGICLLVIVYS